MTPEQQHILYADENGDLEGIFEVQFFEPHLRAERQEALLAMLDDPNPAVRFDSLQILAAWGHSTALDRVLSLLRSDSDDFERQSQHRLSGADTTHDQLGFTMDIAVSNCEHDDTRLREFAKLLLDAARTGFVENGLEAFISRLGDTTLVPQVQSVILEKRDAGDVRGAGDLLPALATLAPATAWELIREFAGQDYFDDLAMGVARTLERIGDADAHRELAVLADRQDLPGASHVARRALDK